MKQSPPSAGSQPVLAAPAQRRNAAFYAAPVEAFLAASDEEAYAPLAAPHGYTLAPEQLSAWRLQLPVLRAALADLPARLANSLAPWIHLELDIPRLGRRVDAVLITDTAVVPIEFKVGAKKFQQTTTSRHGTTGLTSRTFMPRVTLRQSSQSSVLPRPRRAIAAGGRPMLTACGRRFAQMLTHLGRRSTWRWPRPQASQPTLSIPPPGAPAPSPPRPRSSRRRGHSTPATRCTTSPVTTRAL